MLLLLQLTFSDFVSYLSLYSANFPTVSYSLIDRPSQLKGGQMDITILLTDAVWFHFP